MKNFINNIFRFINGLKRPSKKTNLKKLHARGETINSFTFREAARFAKTTDKLNWKGKMAAKLSRLRSRHL